MKKPNPTPVPTPSMPMAKNKMGVPMPENMRAKALRMMAQRKMMDRKMG